jgi:hypothetical protein
MIDVTSSCLVRGVTHWTGFIHTEMTQALSILEPHAIEIPARRPQQSTYTLYMTSEYKQLHTAYLREKHTLETWENCLTRLIRCRALLPKFFMYLELCARNQ